MGGCPCASSAALTVLNGRLPKKPLFALNGDGCGDSITVWLIPSGQTAANEYLVSSGEVVGGNTSFTSVVWTLAAGDFLRAESTGGNVTFMVNGIEQDG